MIEKDKEKTIVVFRKFRDTEEIIAIFPKLQATQSPDVCMSYMHVGQHGSVSYVGSFTKPAKPTEYAALAKELESIGYNLDIREKIGTLRWWSNRKRRYNG